MVLILLIDLLADLNLGLHRWDHNGNGVIDGSELESLPDFMPDPPTPEQMKQFDFDKNGSLDENELKIALGFKDYPNRKYYLNYVILTVTVNSLYSLVFMNPVKP